MKPLPSGLHRGGSQGSTKQATLVSKQGVHSLARGQASSLQQRGPRLPVGSPATGRALTSCVHTCCADGSASNVRLVAILGRTQSGSPCPPGHGGGREETQLSLGSTPTLIPCTRQQTQAQGLLLAALLVRTNATKGQEGSDTGAPGGSGCGEAPTRL